MSVKDTYNCSKNLYNSCTRYFLYIIGDIKEITEYEKKETELALVATYLLTLKEDAVEKLENRSYKSNLDEGLLEKQFSDLFKKIPPIVENGEVKDEVFIFSMLRHKFAHGDFNYDRATDKVEFNILNTNFKIESDEIIKFFIKLVSIIDFRKDEDEIKRTMIFNKSRKILNEKIKNEKYVDLFLNSITEKEIVLKNIHGGPIDLNAKALLEIEIQHIKEEASKGNNTKNIENAVIDEFYILGYSLSIRNKKFKDNEVN